MNNNNGITGTVIAIVIGVIGAVIYAVLVVLGLIPFFLNNKWVMAIVGFITLMVLILMWISRKICKIDNKDIKKIRIIFVVFSSILMMGVIGIITIFPPPPPNENNTVVPVLIGMEIVKASYVAYYAGLELGPIRVEGHEVTFQDPQEGSLVTKNSSVKVVTGKPTIEITFPIDNSSVNSYCYVTGKSSGVASNYPNLKIYVLIYTFSTSKYQVQEPPPPHFNGKWQAKCVFENLPGERFLIYAIITTQEIKEEQFGTFPIYVAMADPVCITRPE